MKRMTPKERFHLAMKNKPVDRPPVCGMTTTATTQLMDAVDAAWPEAHIDATKMARLAIGAYDFFGLESMRVPYCLTYEAEALGAEVNLGKKNSTPMVKGSPYRNNKDIPMELPSEEELMSLARNSIVRDASLKIVEESKKNNLPTVIGVTGPFTIAGHLVGTDDLLLALLLEPDYAKEVVGFTAGYMKMWLREVDTWGADTIQMSEPTASYDMLNQEMFREFALPYLQDIYRVMDNTMKVLHICGNMLPMLDEMAATGADGLSVEEKTDPYEAVKKVNKKAALIGNVGVVKPLLQGTPEDIVIATKRSMDAGFNIISAACGLSALIDRENLLAMTRTVKGE